VLLLGGSPLLAVVLACRGFRCAAATCDRLSVVSGCWLREVREHATSYHVFESIIVHRLSHCALLGRVHCLRQSAHVSMCSVDSCP
jgi:hypothetical protein